MARMIAVNQFVSELSRMAVEVEVIGIVRVGVYSEITRELDGAA
jgi:hypothetical protein